MLPWILKLGNEIIMINVIAMTFPVGYIWEESIVNIGKLFIQKASSCLEQLNSKIIYNIVPQVHIFPFK